MKTKRQTILPYRIEVTASNDGLTSHAGLPLVAETMLALGLDRATYERLHLQQRNGQATGPGLDPADVGWEVLREHHQSHGVAAT